MCGIVMLPVIYLLCVTLSGSSLCGIIACALTACDFMHLTQTRIATVDTYVVLFVLLTFLFMAKYHKTTFGNRKTEWLYLLLSGLFMGCSIASKWNGAYPMVGLALFFFISLIYKFKNSEKSSADKKYVLQTVLFCFAAFVAVPVAVYTLSFIPVIKYISYCCILHCRVFIKLFI